MWTSRFAQSFMPQHFPDPNCWWNITINYGKNICYNVCRISKVYASEKTTIRSCKSSADFQPFQPRVSLPLNFLNYFSCVAVVGFPWYIYFSKWLGWGKLHNDIDLPPFAILLELLVINHSSSERRNIFVPQWLKLSRVLVVLQIAWMRTSPQFSWITRSGWALCLALNRVSGYLWHCSKWFLPVLEVLACSIYRHFNYAITNAPEFPLPSLLTFRLRKFVRGFPN